MAADRSARRSSPRPCRSSSAAGVQGAVVLEQASDPILTLTNRALVRLMTLTLLATLVVGLGLLGYATWLSLRVRRLAGAARDRARAARRDPQRHAGRCGPRRDRRARAQLRGAARAAARAHGVSAHAREQAVARAAHAARRRDHVARQPRARGQSAGGRRISRALAARHGAARRDSRRDERGDGARAGDSRDGRAAVRSRRPSSRRAARPIATSIRSAKSSIAATWPRRRASAPASSSRSCSTSSSTTP